FMVLAPEHPLVAELTGPDRRADVEAYVEAARRQTEIERLSTDRPKTGLEMGAEAINPVNDERLPIYIADYVLAGYGTGAIMAVPAHDERDFAFANHFGLELPQVIVPNAEHDFAVASWDEKEGKLINSDFLNGLEVKAAIKKAIEAIEKKNIGKGKINYRLRDAVFGRQRYWGEPIPVYYKNGIPYAMEESELPLVLPEVDKYLPTETGEP